LAKPLLLSPLSPKYIRYAAPQNLTVLKAITLSLKTTANPNTHRIAATEQPHTTPAAVAMAALREYNKEFLLIKMKSGPGLAIAIKIMLDRSVISANGMSNIFLTLIRLKH